MARRTCQSVSARYAEARPTWVTALQQAYLDDPLLQREGGEGLTAALFSAWAVPLPWLTGT